MTQNDIVQKLWNLCDVLLLRQFSATVSARGAQLKVLTDTQAEIQANQERLRLWDMDRAPAIESHGHATFGQLGKLRFCPAVEAKPPSTERNRCPSS